MSNRMIDLALAVRAPLSVSARMTLFVLANRADDDGDCWPPLDTLMQETGLSRRGVQYAIDELSETQLLTCSDGRGRGRGKVFHLDFAGKGADLAPIEAKKDAARAPYREAKGADLAPIARIKGANDDDKRCKSQQIKGANDDTSGGTIGGNPKDLTQKEPTEKIPLVPNGTSPTPKKYPDDFEEWWRACPPLMRRCGKGDGYEAWRKAKNRPALTEMLRVLAFQVVSYAWTKEGGKYIPMATTYLNRSRWDAEEDAFPRDGPSPNGNGAYNTPADQRLQRIKDEKDEVIATLKQMEARKHGTGNVLPRNRLDGGTLAADSDERNESRVVDIARRHHG